MALPNNNTMYIAGLKTVGEWKILSSKLKCCPTEKLWNEAFNDFFLERLRTRYLTPATCIQNMGKDVGEGFSIVTIYCSLIEYLASTRNGSTHRYLKRGEKLRAFEYANSKKLFVDFLRQVPPFDDLFTKRQAKEFYASVRCGLFHEARTKGKWRIRNKENNRPALDAAKHRVNRGKLSNLFEEYVTKYEQEFKDEPELREALKRKFDSLCE